MLGALLTRSRKAVAAAVLPGVVWGIMFGPALLRTAPGGPSDLAVATLNVGVANSDSGKAVRAVAKDRDLFAAQELTPGGPAAKELDKRFPHRVQVSTIGLWSRFPITGHRTVDIGLGWTRALRAVVETPRGR
nr:hypothetical protein GCM10020093_114810 [Planobispora longispora]